MGATAFQRRRRELAKQKEKEGVKDGDNNPGKSKKRAADKRDK